MSAPLTIPQETRASQELASRPQLSAWVKANAGSGKTYVLAQRVIRLLMEGTDPSKILCLTYTRAAAANMARRVFDSLAAWTMLPDDELSGKLSALDGLPATAGRLARARRLFARALETPGGLKIQTIHAFCEAVLHQFPLEANIAGHFELMDAQMEAALTAEARRQMIAATRAEPLVGGAFAAVLACGGESGLEALLSEIVSRRDALRGFIDETRDADGRHRALFEAFGFAEGDTAEAIAAAIWPDPYFDIALGRAVSDRAAAAGKSTAADFAADLVAAAGTDDPGERLDRLRPIFLRKQTGGVWMTKSAGRIMSKGVGEHFPGFVQEFERFAGAIDAASDRRGLFETLRASEAALAIADWLIARYERLKRARGVLDFNDLIVRTAALLAREDAGAWVQFKLDQGIDHILLDESQDTSPGQWSVVRALSNEFFAGFGARGSAPRTVFAVGDEKQSIYSFQGAEPEAFALEGHAFGSRAREATLQFETIRLRHSFRSTSDVLSAVDLVFADETARDGLTRDPEVLFHPAIRATDSGHVELWPSIGPETVVEPDDWTESIDHASAPAARLAGRIAETIAHWREVGDSLPGRRRLLDPGDVLVLVRKRDAFVHALTRELKDRNIPVAGADRLLLTGHIAVQDLMAAARIVLQPEDDLSLAALLRSPVFGLGEDQLYRLAADRPAGVSLLDALRRSAGDDPALAAIAGTIDRWRREAGFRSAFDFFATLLGRDGLRRRLVARLGRESADIIDEFMTFCLAAEKTGIASLPALLALLEGGGPDVKRELDQARGEVRIMTVHASKGLEAPVVFLVDSGSAPFSETHLPPLVPFDAPDRAWRGKGWLWRTGAANANAFLRGIEAEHRRLGEQEYRRLLYVAMTRAEDRLVVAGYHGRKGAREDAWHAMVSRALAGSPHSEERTHPVTGETILRYAVSDHASAGGVEPVSPPSPAAPRTPPPVVLFEPLPPPLPHPRPLVPSGAGVVVEASQEPVLSMASPVLDPERAPSFALERGVAAHRLLQLLPDIDPSTREAAAIRYLGKVGAAWPQDERERLWRSVEAILGDDAFAPLFAPGSRAEVSLMGTIMVAGMQRAVSGKIDRLVVTDADVLIVDFKTGRPAATGPDQVPAAHVAQMAIYAALLRPLYPGRRMRAALVYTEAPALVTLAADTLDEALARLGSA